MKLETSISNDEVQNSVNFMNAEYEDFNAKKSVLDNDVRKIEEKLTAFCPRISGVMPKTLQRIEGKCQGIRH